ncbi:MAG: TetR/AcrR family transcriptional regulator [Labedaea sp.]
MTRTRLTAAERSDQLVEAAITAFAATGYAGTTTDDVARLAGVSQPYVIRLFGSKQNLFLAAVKQACGRIEETFRRAAENDPELAGLADAYGTLLTERDLLGVLLHGYAASADPAIGDVVRRGFGRIYQVIREITGAPVDEVRSFIAHGMLLTVLSAMRVIGPDPVPPDPWMAELIESFTSDFGPDPC